MAEQFAIYKCDVCVNVVELLHAAGGELHCCGKPMREMRENTTDAATEKHVPVLEANGTGCKVTVSTVAHPMLEEHLIQWIEVANEDGRRCKVFLKPGQAPEATFCMPKEKVTSVREYCNLHGLWKA